MKLWLAAEKSRITTHPLHTDSVQRRSLEYIAPELGPPLDFFLLDLLLLFEILLECLSKPKTHA